ncbi:MAG TPA: nucleotidyl transferase AbiEii/AbiGii toxin family protein [Acidiferrobacterales bacterium]|nr:nucleotidyl transferase AbiEii/AbiGii toxin family protein [Acidiferrobacterales bacterium]
MTAGRAASIHARLLNLAKARGEDFNLILSRYAIERFLYRLSLVPARDAYWLKGALLFDLWFDVPHRPTRDADFLGFGPVDSEALAVTIREICGVAVDDGMEYDPASITIEEIREDARYGGLRVRLVGRLGNGRCTVQLDVGYGDAVTPGPEEAIYPTLLEDQPPPRLRVYPRAAVVAEKLEAMVSLGMANSRMKDYFDLRALAREGVLDARLLGEAIAATFERRRTVLPEGELLGLSDEFAQDVAMRAQWKAFLSKNRLDAPALDEVIVEVRRFVAEPLRLARQKMGAA